MTWFTDGIAIINHPLFSPQMGGINYLKWVVYGIAIPTLLMFTDLYGWIEGRPQGAAVSTSTLQEARDSWTQLSSGVGTSVVAAAAAEGDGWKNGWNIWKHMGK